MSTVDVRLEPERRPGGGRGSSGRVWTTCLAGVLVAVGSVAACGQPSLFPRNYGPVEPIWMADGWLNGPGAGFGTGWSPGGGYEHWQYGYGFPEYSDYRLDVPYPPGVPGVPFHRPGRVLVYPNNGPGGYPMVLPGWLGPVEVQPAWPPAQTAPQAVPRREVLPTPEPERPAAPRPRVRERVPGDEELAPPPLPNGTAPAEALPPPPPANGQ